MLKMADNRLYSRLGVFLIGLAVMGCGGSSSRVTTGPGVGVTTKSVARAVGQAFAISGQRAGTVQSIIFSKSAMNSSFHIGASTSAAGVPFFVDYFQVWSVDYTQANGLPGQKYFLDQALTMPAGGTETTFASNSKSVQLSVTAGPLAGYVLTYSNVATATGTHFTSIGTHPIYGTFQSGGDFDSKTGITTFQSTFNDENGNQRYYNWVSPGDGTSTVTMNNANLFDLTLHYAVDQSGQGSVTGSSNLLPATISWDTQGNGQVLFKGGSSVTFAHFSFNF